MWKIFFKMTTFFTCRMQKHLLICHWLSQCVLSESPGLDITSPFKILHNYVHTPWNTNKDSDQNFLWNGVKGRFLSGIYLSNVVSVCQLWCFYTWEVLKTTKHGGVVVRSKGAMLTSPNTGSSIRSRGL